MTSNALQQPKSRAVIFSLLTLLSGIVIGVGATLIFVGPPPDNPLPPGPEYFSSRMVEVMTRELALTPQQQEAIRTVIESHMTVVDQIREEAQPKIRQELDTMNSEIKALLDENQQRQWEENIRRMQERFREARERRERRGPRDRDRFRRGEGPGGDPNSPFFRRRRPGEGPGGDPNSPFFRRRRGGDQMNPDMRPPDVPPPDRPQPGQPVEAEQPPQDI